MVSIGTQDIIKIQMNHYNDTKGVIHVPLFPRQGGQVPVSEQSGRGKHDKHSTHDMRKEYPVSVSSDERKSEASEKQLSSTKSSSQEESIRNSKVEGKGKSNKLPSQQENADGSIAKSENDRERSYYTRPPAVRQYSYNWRRGGTPRQWYYDTQTWGQNAKSGRKMDASKYDANKRVPRAKSSSKSRTVQSGKADSLDKNVSATVKLSRVNAEIDKKPNGYFPSQNRNIAQRQNSKYSYSLDERKPYRISPLEYESLGRNIPESYFDKEEYNFREPDESMKPNKQEKNYDTESDFYFTKEPNTERRGYGTEKSQQNANDGRFFESKNNSHSGLPNVDDSVKKDKATTTTLGQVPPPPPLKNSKWTPHPPIKKSSVLKQMTGKENKTLASKSQNNFRRTYFSRRHYPYLRFKRNAIGYHGNGRSKRSLRDFIATTDHMTLVLDHVRLEDEALYECQVKPLGGPAYWGRAELQVHGKHLEV